MDHCPNCQSRQIHDNACARCGCELILLSTIRVQAHHLAKMAMRSVMREDYQGAEYYINEALKLYHHKFFIYLKQFILYVKTDTTNVFN